MNIYDILKQNNIKYKEIEHKKITTIEEAKKLNIKKILNGIECKNLFVKSKNNYYIILTDASKKIDLKEIAKQINQNRFSFANENELKEILNLEIGSVTPLGIINDTENKVTLLLDKELEKKEILVHPNINTKTMLIKFNDLIKIIENTNHKYYLINT